MRNFTRLSCWLLLFCGLQRPVFGQVSSASDGMIQGKVTSTTGEELPGVNVVVKGTNTGTTTDATGAYKLTASASSTLVFSFIGYVSQEIPVGTQARINVQLATDTKSLDEIVVVGYGTKNKTNLTGSVATVNPKDLRSVPMPTVTQSLMGRAAGVFIKNGNGQPGENKVNYNIRGFGTALLIIDGLPASDNDFNQLDPNDIENISILKDAASAAVYGARAGNGVVLVTTRRGGVSDAKFTYTSNYGLQYFAIRPEFVNAEQYARMENVSRANQGLAPVWTDDEIRKLGDGTDPKYPNTDWWKATLRTYAPQIQHNINVQGGTEKVKYFVSGGYFSQQGLERESETRNNRYNLRSNLDVALTKRLKLGLNLSALYQTYYGSAFQMERTSSTVGIMTMIFRARPNFLAEYPDPTKLPTTGGSEIAPNSLIRPDQVGYKSWNKLTGDAKVQFSYDLPFGFQARANFHAYRLNDQYKEKKKRTPVYSYNTDTDAYTFVKYTSDPSRLYEKNSTENNLNQQYFLTWNRTFGDHNVNALAVYEVLSNTTNWIEASRIRYDFDIDYLFAGPDLDKDNNGSATQGGRKGWITRLNYDYQGKYLVELNSRADASPKFPKATRWGFFPSASVGWRISEEAFMKDHLPFISNLKLRASYGKLGYDNVGNFQYLQNYSIGSQFIYDGASNVLEKGIRADALANPLITWEKMTTSDVGLDFNLWGTKLEGSFDYFYRLRSDVLGTRIQSLPNVVGANMPQVNYAKYDNRGVELTLNHRNVVRDFEYSIGGNIAWNREKALLIDQSDFASEEARRRGNRVDRWTDQVWGKKTDGLFQSKEEIAAWADQDGKNNATILPGDVKFIDYNGDGRITAEDEVVIGRGTFPKLSFGVNLSVAWKGFDFSMLWQGAGLYDINLRSSPDLSQPFYAANTPLTDMLTDSYVPVMENQWLPVNTSARWPLYRTDNYNRSHVSYSASDFWLINGSYMRLKNAELGYTIPRHITQKIKVDRCKVYLSGSNLLTFSALKFMDPEIDTSPARTLGDYYPPVGTYNAGLLIQF
ncbi:SusC/RagA family TonB-linked outer membrane protein [Larkinella bovis]|uniref:SusC/RagA family TonB-linked outer membrane protein n=1 Tax=Larkinella bovis TaxID=683041 RepID=A0ABW0I9U9_9BACT